jgi:hypothetical protein
MYFAGVVEFGVMKHIWLSSLLTKEDNSQYVILVHPLASDSSDMLQTNVRSDVLFRKV